MGRHRVFFLALATLLGCVVLVQTQQSIEAQTMKSWADVKTAASWDDRVVDLVIPGSGTVPSRVERVQAKFIVVRPSRPSGPSGAIALVDPYTSKTCILPGGDFFISGKSGMVGISIAFWSLWFYPSFWESPTTPGGTSDAIARFAAEFSEQQAADHYERRTRTPARLEGANMPSDFYVVGSQPVGAKLQALEVRDGVLRLDLRSVNGTLGSFWVDLTTHQVAKTQFGR